MENKRRIGSEYEQRAEQYLMEKGYRILERNFRNRMGEIDVIASQKGVIVFCEVKYRTSSAFGSPLEAVDWRKQNQIRKVAQFYLMCHGRSEWTPCRFDVIAFEGENMTHVENAF
jgi:putative endonuclease